MQILVGAGVFALCVAVHACFMLWSVRVIGPKLRRKGTSLDLVSTMVATVGFLAIAHFIEICLWALAISFVGAVSAEEGPLYFAFTSYTTLGYGDVVPAVEWRLFAALEGVNGFLLIGWSTAYLIAAGIRIGPFRSGEHF